MVHDSGGGLFIVVLLLTVHICKQSIPMNDLPPRVPVVLVT